MASLRQLFNNARLSSVILGSAQARDLIRGLRPFHAHARERTAQFGTLETVPRAREDWLFHGRFYGQRNFGCQDAQFCAI